MEPALKHWTLNDWDRMIAGGVLTEDDRVMLLEGEIFEMSPQDWPHSQGLGLTQDALTTVLAPDTHLRVQLPLYLGASSDPEPDLAVVAGTRREQTSQPTTALLVVEVSDSSLAVDLGRKAKLYARYGIPLYWVLDVLGRRVHVHSRPHELGYEALEVVPASGSLTWAGQPLRVADLLP